MDTTEFKALAKGHDLKRVTITIYQSAQATVSAILRCDDDLDELTAYNFLRDLKGEIVKYASVEEATAAIHKFGYRGEISFVRAGGKSTENPT